MWPPTRAPFPKTPTGPSGPASPSCTLTHVHRAASLPTEKEGEPTRRDKLVMTPRPRARLAGRSSRKSTGKSHLSSRRNVLAPPAPSGAARASSFDFSQKSKGDTTRETVGSDSHRDLEEWCSRTGTLQVRTADESIRLATCLLYTSPSPRD